MLERSFFDRDACRVARELLGKVLRHRVDGVWLSAAIIETEAYYRREQGSHASQGRTPSREAVFMRPGTIYMYYSRAGDSLNVSCRGAGDAVLIKSGRPFVDARSPESTLAVMQRLNPRRRWRRAPPEGPTEPRPPERLCAGQTLLCRALGLTVKDWDQRDFDRERFYIEDVGSPPERIIKTRRLGIPTGRDEHLMYRFIDHAWARQCTQNPLTKRSFRAGVDYFVLPGPTAPGEGDSDDARSQS
jgi:DNA-3-methyladenine glycosylase